MYVTINISFMCNVLHNFYRKDIWYKYLYFRKFSSKHNEIIILRRIILRIKLHYTRPFDFKLCIKYKGYLNVDFDKELKDAFLFSLNNSTNILLFSIKIITRYFQIYAYSKMAHENNSNTTYLRFPKRNILALKLKNVVKRVAKFL